MSRLLYRLGTFTASRPWLTIVTWIAVAIGVTVLAGAVGGTPKDDYTIPNSSSQTANDLLTGHFPELSGGEARVVAHVDSGELPAAALTKTEANLAAMPKVAFVEPAVLSADGRTSITTVRYSVPVTDLTPTDDYDALKAAGQPLREAGVAVELGGQFPENLEAPSGIAEMIGILGALIVLLFAFGSIVAAGLPLAIALVGVGVGISGISLYAAFADVSTVAPILGTMIGLGVGIDYALFVVTRHREGLAAGLPIRESIGRANATAGESVVFAGGTVLLAIGGLSFAGVPNFATMGYSAGIVVAISVLASISLLPALLGLAKLRVFSRKVRRTGVEATAVAATEPWSVAWARRVARRPLIWGVGAFALLVTLCLPVLSLSPAMFDAGSNPTSSTTRKAYDLVADNFGRGVNGPLVIAADLNQLSRDQVTTISTQVKATAGVLEVAPPEFSPDGKAAVIVAFPTSGPQDQATTDLVTDLRNDLPTGTDVTGPTAVYVDLSQRLTDRLPLVIALVLALSFVLLMAVFRSILVPLKAVVMNMLSVGAAYGVVTAVFQWGWGAELLGLPGETPVAPFVPILMFVISFGLSMDYEVFLLSRVREHYLETGDARQSVISGLGSTGRVITSAAAIMVLVFLGFAADPAVVVKMIGVGLATAILIDATIVRMVLVPAAMALMGHAAWWFPGRSVVLTPTPAWSAAAPAAGQDSASDRHRQPAGQS